MTEQTTLSPKQVTYIQSCLLSWFETNQRNFPWRHASSPYAVLIAEKLLQQTAARDCVIEAFHALIEKYPTPAALSRARLEDLEEIVFPLGFHYRARELKRLGTALVEQFSGKVPTTREELKTLPGVGEYAARAVLSFYYQKDVAVVDTNVARFLHRVLGIPGKLPSNPARKKTLLDLAAKLLPVGKSKEFNLAVLDLCALICTPIQPQCTSCPIQPHCSLGRTRESQVPANCMPNF